MSIKQCPKCGAAIIDGQHAAPCVGINAELLAALELGVIRFGRLNPKLMSIGMRHALDAMREAIANAKAKAKGIKS